MRLEVTTSRRILKVVIASFVTISRATLVVKAPYRFRVILTSLKPPVNDRRKHCFPHKS